MSIGRTRRAAASERAIPVDGLNESWVASAQRRGRSFWLRDVLIGCLLAVAGPVTIVSLHHVIGAAGIERPALILFAVPILLAVHVGGLVPGLIATALSALLSDYFLIAPIPSLEIGSMIDTMQLQLSRMMGAKHKGSFKYEPIFIFVKEN